MYLLDLLSALVPLIGITECVSTVPHEITNECGHLRILNHENLYYGGNVTLVFQPKKKSKDKLEIKNHQSVHFDYVYEAGNETHTFVLIHCLKNLQYADFYVKYDCTSGYVRLRFNEERSTEKETGQAIRTNAFMTTTIAKINDTTTEIQNDNVTNVNAQTQSSKTFTEKSNRLTSTKSTTDGQDKRTDTSTKRSQPISNAYSTDASVLNPSAANDGFQNVVIAVACVVSAVIIVIAVVIAVVCVKRKRRSVANVPLQDTPREVQVAQEEGGNASIGGSECQYAVVNKPKKQSTLQAKQDPPVENKPMEMQSKAEKPTGAGELIYADLDKEALTAKPINSTPAGAVEYVGIDFARTVALQDANKQEE